MPVIDNMYYYGGEVDAEFTRIANELDNCPYLKIYKSCDNCPYYNKCERLFNRLSSRSSTRRLTEEDVKYFQTKYYKLAGILL